MPNYYAHLVFGRRVLSHLPALLRSGLGREEDAFLAGCLGPDPLFFSHSPRPNLSRQAGIHLHNHSFRAPAEGLLAAVEAGAPFAGSYAAGFLCHFALDSACHPFIAEQAAHGLAHSAMESELDRTLMLAAGADPLHRTPLPPFRLPGDFFTTVTAAVCPTVSPEAFRQALSSFRLVCRLQTKWAGTWVQRAADGLGRFPQLSALRGSLLTPRPDPACVPAAAALLQVLEDSVVPTAQVITGFFSAAKVRGTLDSWYDRDFYGARAPVPVMV